VRNDTVVGTRIGAVSTERPDGIVRSMAWRVSSVASAKCSALPEPSPSDQRE
jgi:hypothetical protein